MIFFLSKVLFKITELSKSYGFNNGVEALINNEGESIIKITVKDQLLEKVYPGLCESKINLNQYKNYLKNTGKLKGYKKKDHNEVLPEYILRWAKDIYEIRNNLRELIDNSNIQNTYPGLYIEIDKDGNIKYVDGIFNYFQKKLIKIKVEDIKELIGKSVLDYIEKYKCEIIAKDTYNIEQCNFRFQDEFVKGFIVESTEKPFLSNFSLLYNKDIYDDLGKKIKDDFYILPDGDKVMCFSRKKLRKTMSYDNIKKITEEGIVLMYELKDKNIINAYY